ncbi:M15 family metallopeptidase domain-containing protein [Porticoccus sp.]
MSYSFGKRSADNLAGCDSRLQRVAARALSFGVMDFSVICGRRSIEEQKRLYSMRMTQIDGITRKSKHMYTPSLAMDLMPYPAEVNGINVWDDHQRFHVLAGLIYAAAHLEGVKIRWGGDWDGDGNNADSSFLDLPHFEVNPF